MQVMPYTLVLGDNEISNCDAAIVVEGVEVFRLRDRDRDGKLIVDFDLREPDGKRIAKIAKNYVAHAAEGYEHQNRPGVSEVVETHTGRVLARVEEVAPRRVRVTGTFCVEGLTVEITGTGVLLGTNLISGCRITGFGKAIEFDRKRLGIGVGHPS
jgi:hypothetical protein